MNIKLTCSLCGGEVVYEPKTSVEQDRAHARLHKKDCLYLQCKERLAWIAEHGQPVESEPVN